MRMDDYAEMDVDPEIAAAMGFGSFGNQAKKRKFNNDDAFTGNSKLRQPDSSGANNVQLGVRQKKTPTDTTVTACVGGEEASKSTTADLERSKSPAKAKGKQKQAAPSGLAAFLQRAKDIPDRTVEEKVPPNMVSLTSLPPNTSLPPKPPPSDSEAPAPSPGRDDLHSLAKGRKNARGDTYFFLPSFIEDPWKGLERRKG